MKAFFRYFTLLVCIIPAIMFPIETFAQGSTIPPIEIKDTDGVRHKLTACIKTAKPNIIILWKGCCTDGISLLEEINDWITDEQADAALLGISCDNIRNNRKVIGQVRAIGYEGPVLIDENQDLVRILGINVFPVVLITNGEGTILWRREGYSPSVVEMVKARINEQ